MALAQPDGHARKRALLDLMYTPAWFGHRRRSQLLGDPAMTHRSQTLHLRASGRHDAAERLFEIRVPTLVMHGSDDRMAPVVNAEIIADRIRDAEAVITPEGRHGFFDEFEHEVTSTVRLFLGRS
jgi:pimeloyl-ACP methyl ester carboxylesterase